ncbi:MAG: 16S rRNA (cytosine(1402)-N(4))-methyltransferase RsmH [Cyclobacteriaceae bacterium]|nr:16S rRNA (cytosine(1402)-N(4))-methyltransferase RsmH [Cyclobacteriaceae bacterium]
MEYHIPVLLNESVEGLDIHPGGTYVDVTFGGGGHSAAIYQKLSNGRLIAFDQDPDANKNTRTFESDENRSFLFVPSNFRHIKRYLKFHGSTQVDGILADLGVSSHQFDEQQRGFSTRFDSALDMRMDYSSPGLTAKEVINSYEESDLVHVLSLYGEIINARTLAARIVRQRNQAPIETTSQLKAIATEVAPRGKTAKYLAQLFQAIRIEVNDEMGALKEMLTQCADVLKPEGRLVVISYHSLEDRLVKNFISSGNFKGKQEKDFYGNLIRPLDPFNRKPIVPGEEEIAENNRARSAKLRIAVKK